MAAFAFAGRREGQDVGFSIDIEAVSRVNAASATGADKDLNKVLPKLAKRINNSKSPQIRSPNRSDAPSPYTPRQDSSEATPEQVSTAKRRNTRKSIRGSLVFKVETDLPPEAEELRGRDIEPDEDSAAFRALSKAAAMSYNPDESTPKPFDAGEILFQDRRVVEGREIQQGHAQYALTYGMMLGIRCTTGRRELVMQVDAQRSTLSKINSMAVSSEHELSERDYAQSVELHFAPQGGTVPLPTPPHKLPFTFTFKDYMTNVFRAVRALSNIDEADYMMSLAGDFNYIEFIANSKSGQFFFYSHDGRYMIKTQTKEECRLLKQIMPQYVQHLTDHPDSLLVKFYGLHRVKMPSLRSKTYFVIMSSVFSTPMAIHVKYDLKGSTVGRRTELDAALQGAVQKDLNLQESGRKIMLGEDQVDVFYDTLKADTTFLRDLNIMDYSLLVGVHEAWRENKAPNPAAPLPGARRRSSCGVVLSQRYHGTGDSIYNANNAYNSYVSQLNSAYNNAFSAAAASVSIFQSCCGGIRSAPQAQEIYFLGVIDILQLYTSSKKMETFIKGFTNNAKQVSCVDPSWYAERMLRFVMVHTDYPAVLQARKLQARQLSGGRDARSHSAPQAFGPRGSPLLSSLSASSIPAGEPTSASAESQRTSLKSSAKPPVTDSGSPKKTSFRERGAYDML